MHKLSNAHFDHGMLPKFIELLQVETPVPKNVFLGFLGFETLVQVLNTDSGQDSRFHYPFEKSFLELQHACLNLKWAVCVVFLLQRNSQLLSQILDILPSINRSDVKLYNGSLFLSFDKMRQVLDPSAKSLKLTLK